MAKKISFAHPRKIRGPPTMTHIWSTNERAGWKTNRRTKKSFMVGGVPSEAPKILESSSSHRGFYEGSYPDLLESVNIVLRAAEDDIDNPRWEEHEWEYEYTNAKGDTVYTMNEDEVVANAVKGPNYKYPAATWSITLTGGDGKLYSLSGTSYKRGKNWVSGAELEEVE